LLLTFNYVFENELTSGPSGGFQISRPNTNRSPLPSFKSCQY